MLNLVRLSLYGLHPMLNLVRLSLYGAVLPHNLLQEVAKPLCRGQDVHNNNNNKFAVYSNKFALI